MKPSIPRGTRDFGPAEMKKRQYILDIIRSNFELFGYEPIETPAMENIATLTGKYGDEGDKLIFKILDSGDFIEPLSKEHIDSIRSSLRKKPSRNNSGNKKIYANTVRSKHELKRFEETFSSKRLTPEISEKALRYDLTVPFARYIVMNKHNLTFPFKRYQIQPVWRADRPQKGRYREFYQCDADVIGSNSLMNELELISLIDKTFGELKVPVVLKVNNRKILAGIAEVIGAPERMLDIAIAVDKLDKIGREGVKKELIERGFNETQIARLNYAFEFQENTIKNIGGSELGIEQWLRILESEYGGSEIFKNGTDEIRYIFLRFELNKTKHLKLELDITLARGLNYYTGTIFEVKANAGTFTSSILGGGRYDDLTGIFGLPNMSGVGISFGVDRIADVMEELNLFPEHLSKPSSSKVLFTHFDEATQIHCLQLAAALRTQNISCEIYPDVIKKLGKQFDYANKKNIPFVCTVGGNEMSTGEYALKDMQSGEQEKLTIEKIIEKLK